MFVFIRAGVVVALFFGAIYELFLGSYYGRGLEIKNEWYILPIIR